MNTGLKFNGNIPQYYEDILTPFLFNGFSKKVSERIDFSSVRNLLELASGTGSLTKLLVSKLPSNAHLTVTDLQGGMLEVAKRNIEAENVSWDVVDMTQIPYADETSDLIICQFGLMLVPDKIKAITEIHRVLKPGGKLVFTVWGDINDNPVWKISGEVIESFLGTNPMLQDPGPFSLAMESDIQQLLKNVNFTSTEIVSLRQTGIIESAAMAAKGFIQGLPVFMAIHKIDPDLIGKIQHDLELKLIESLGNAHLQSPLTAWITEATK